MLEVRGSIREPIPLEICLCTFTKVLAVWMQLNVTLR